MEQGAGSSQESFYRLIQVRMRYSGVSAPPKGFRLRAVPANFYRSKLGCSWAENGPMRTGGTGKSNGSGAVLAGLFVWYPYSPELRTNR